MNHYCIWWDTSDGGSAGRKVFASTGCYNTDRGHTSVLQVGVNLWICISSCADRADMMNRRQICFWSSFWTFNVCNQKYIMRRKSASYIYYIFKNVSQKCRFSWKQTSVSPRARCAYRTAFDTGIWRHVLIQITASEQTMNELTP